MVFAINSALKLMDSSTGICFVIVNNALGLPRWLFLINQKPHIDLISPIKHVMLPDSWFLLLNTSSPRKTRLGFFVVFFWYVFPWKPPYLLLQPSPLIAETDIILSKHLIVKPWLPWGASLSTRFPFLPPEEQAKQIPETFHKCSPGFFST